MHTYDPYCPDCGLTLEETRLDSEPDAKNPFTVIGHRELGCHCNVCDELFEECDCTCPDCGDRFFEPEDIAAEVEDCIDRDKVLRFCADCTDGPDGELARVELLNTYRDKFFGAWFLDVRDFSKKFGAHVARKPSIPPEKVRKLRPELMREELLETEQAIEADDLKGIADGITDLIYVAIGTALAYGIDLRPVWNEVHRANMAKTGGKKRADGKILKPAGWKEPDIAAALEKGLPF